MQAQEEAIAKEWRQYYLTNMILKSYPESSTDIREGINETFKRIQTLSFADSFKKLVTDRFAEVKKQSLVAIESSKAPNYKQQLLALEKSNYFGLSNSTTALMRKRHWTTWKKESTSTQTFKS
jgi:hypothetical protein